MKSADETEVKIALSAIDAIPEKLRDLGFTVSVERLFEGNTLYDTAASNLRKSSMLLRLREVGGKTVITWKGPGTPGPHKSRPELETDIGSFAVMEQIFDRLGYRRTFRYEKYRTEFAPSDDPAKGTVTLDETPIGNFLEIEGPGEWIDATAARLGFSPADYVLSSYGSLYLDYCRRQQVEPRDMVFASAGAGAR
jgi:adenylate cyclase, class 2